jgi:hypothetical protein
MNLWLPELAHLMDGFSCSPPRSLRSHSLGEAGSESRVTRLADPPAFGGPLDAASPGPLSVLDFVRQNFRNPQL